MPEGARTFTLSVEATGFRISLMRTNQIEAIRANAEQVSHCISKMAELLEREEGMRDLPDRDILQLGYNAGRLGELTLLGREVWDSIKEPVEDGRKEDVAAYLRVIASYVPGYDWEAENDRNNFLSGKA